MTLSQEDVKKINTYPSKQEVFLELDAEYRVENIIAVAHMLHFSLSAAGWYYKLQFIDATGATTNPNSKTIGLRAQLTCEEHEYCKNKITVAQGVVNTNCIQIIPTNASKVGAHAHHRDEEVMSMEGWNELLCDNDPRAVAAFEEFKMGLPQYLFDKNPKSREQARRFLAKLMPCLPLCFVESAVEYFPDVDTNIKRCVSDETMSDSSDGDKPKKMKRKKTLETALLPIEAKKETKKEAPLVEVPHRKMPKEDLEEAPLVKKARPSIEEFMMAKAIAEINAFMARVPVTPDGVLYMWDVCRSLQEDF